MTTPFPFVSGAVLTAAQLNSITELIINDKTGRLFGKQGCWHLYGDGWCWCNSFSQRFSRYGAIRRRHTSRYVGVNLHIFSDCSKYTRIRNYYCFRWWCWRQ
jgi:hypothetical protein